MKQRKVHFQTPFPAKLQEFYENGVLLYQTAEEATTDMKDRGLPVIVITPKESLAEQLSHFASETLGGPRRWETGERRAAGRGCELPGDSTRPLQKSCEL